MCEPENLILAVKKYPCIWDIHNGDYHNRDVKDLAWEEVCKEVLRDWDTCTDQTYKSADLKKKWTNIRDYYRKEVQKLENTPTGRGVKKMKKYVYADMLHFLKPMFQKRNSERIYQTDTEYLSENTESQLSKDMLEPEIIIREERSTTQSPEPLSPTPEAHEKNKEATTRTPNILQQREQIAEKEEDDDTKFLLSFRTYMRRMTVNQKLDFQIGMLQLVKKINLEC